MAPMRRLAALVLVTAALVAGCGRAPASGAQAEQVFDAAMGLERIASADRQPLPVVAGATIDGGEASTAQALGTVLVLNAWASWCPPCRKELPLLQASYATADPNAVTFLGLDVNDDPAAAKALAEQTGVGYRSISDPTGALFASLPDLAGAGLPVTLFADRDGRLAARIIGAVQPGQVDDVVAWIEANP